MSETASNSMDIPAPDTIEQAVRERNGWIDSAAMFHRNECYYRDLLDEIGSLLGPGAHTCDDGSFSESVLRAKLPELVRDALARGASV